MDEIERIEEELKQTQLSYQMATQMSQFKAGFLARTAHELRSPLSSLIGLHQLILSDLCESPEEAREFLTQAYQSAQKLVKIIGDIVAVSKMECGRSPLDLQPLQLAKVFSDLDRLTHLQAANRNLQLKVLPPDPQIQIVADSQRLLQVLVMLADTAITHAETGKIQVWTDSSRGYDSVAINIDIPCPASLWSEPVNLLDMTVEPTGETAKSFSQKLELSPGMKFLLAQTLLDLMGGRLKIVDVSPEAAKEYITRLQCSIPLAPAGALEQKLALD